MAPVAAAVLPHPPLLVPELAGAAAPELAPLRAACHEALSAVVAAADLTILIGDGPVWAVPARRPRLVPPLRRRRRGRPSHPGRPRPPRPPPTGPAHRPPPVARRRRPPPGRPGPAARPAVRRHRPRSLGPRAAAAIGHTLAAATARFGLVVMADLRPAEPNGAPGAFHPEPPTSTPGSRAPSGPEPRNASSPSTRPSPQPSSSPAAYPSRSSPARSTEAVRWSVQTRAKAERRRVRPAQARTAAGRGTQPGRGHPGRARRTLGPARFSDAGPARFSGAGHARFSDAGTGAVQWCRTRPARRRRIVAQQRRTRPGQS